MFRQTIVRVRAEAFAEQSGADAVQRDWANAVRTSFGACNVQPEVVDEAEDSTGIRSAARWKLHRQGRLDLVETDRVEYDGRVLEVTGVKHWPRSSGGWHHTEAYLTEESLWRASSGVDAAQAAQTAALGAASRRWSVR